MLHKPPYVLPDAVNLPTLNELRRFVVDHLRLPADIVKEHTVRELVTLLCRFSATQTRCWDMKGLLVHGPAAAPPNLNAALRASSVVAQIFALCAAPVVAKVEELLGQAGAAGRADESGAAASVGCSLVVCSGELLTTLLFAGTTAASWALAGGADAR